MKIALISTVGLTLASQLAAQANGESEPFMGRTRAVVTDSVVTPPTENPNEGPMRFPDLLPEDPGSYVELTPTYGPQRRHFGPTQAVRFDPATGVETVMPGLSLPEPSTQWLAGQQLMDELEEPLTEVFGSLSAVSGSTYPWSTSCRIFFTQAGGNYVCSGTMLDPKHVISAGHCVHSGGSSGVWSTNVVVAPSWDGDANAFGTANGVELTTFTPWTQSRNYGGDMAFIELDRPVGFLTGWLGTGYSSSTSWWLATTFHMAGYPGGCFAGAPHQRYYSFGTFDSVNSTNAYADLSATCWVGGMSGSGVYFRDSYSGQRFVYANLSHGWGAPTSTTKVGMCRMTQAKFTAMQAVFASDYSTTQEDIVPLTVRTSATSVARGAALPNLTYKLCNASQFNPPSLLRSIDVYLSTNANISAADMKIQSHNVTWDFGVNTGVTVGAPPPVIPATLAPGVYYLGIIVRNADADTSNNDTDDFDAVRITVY